MFASIFRWFSTEKVDFHKQKFFTRIVFHNKIITFILILIIKYLHNTKGVNNSALRIKQDFNNHLCKHFSKKLSTLFTGYNYHHTCF